MVPNFVNIMNSLETTGSAQQSATQLSSHILHACKASMNRLSGVPSRRLIGGPTRSELLETSVFLPGGDISGPEKEKLPIGQSCMLWHTLEETQKVDTAEQTRILPTTMRFSRSGKGKRW